MKNGLFLRADPGTHFADNRGGVNGSTQHSARTRTALKTIAKSAHQVRITQNAVLVWVQRVELNKSVSLGKSL